MEQMFVHWIVFSSGIRWGGAHSQYFPIQPFTNSVTLCHNPVSQSCVTIVFHNPLSQLCFTIVFHNPVSQLCFTIQSDCEVTYCTPCTMYSPWWCTVPVTDAMCTKTFEPLHILANHHPHPNPQGLSTRVSQDGIMKVSPHPHPAIMHEPSQCHLTTCFCSLEC